MVLNRSHVLAAFAVAVLAFSVLASSDAFAATAALSAGGHHWFADVVAASPALLLLRNEIDALTDKAKRKFEEIKDDLAPEQIRAIEAEHADILREIDAKRAERVRLESEDPVATERKRTADILELAGRTGTGALAARAVADGVTFAAFKDLVLDEVAKGEPGKRIATGGGRVEIVRDETETRRVDMQAALGAEMARRNGVTVTVSDGARRYMDRPLSDLACEVLGERNLPRNLAQREAVLERAFQTTSDFPIIFSGAINARLLASYEAAQPTYRSIAQRADFHDFRPHDQIRAGDFPLPKAVGQAGEIKFGTFGEKKETIAVAPYAVQFNLTRQMLVNDNLGAIDRVLGNYGTTVALFEEITFYAMKNVSSGVGPTLVETSRAVFNTTDGTLAASGTVISTASLGAGRAALRKMKRLDGNPMGLAPAILLVSPDKETEAETVLAAIVPRMATDVNLFTGRLRPVVSAQLTGNAWEVYTEPSMGANWAWGLLDGYNAPRLRMENKFGVQGVGISLEHDFGCGAVDYRFGYRNPGA